MFTNHTQLGGTPGNALTGDSVNRVQKEEFSCCGS